MKTPCEDCGGKYCMCEVCRSMREAMEDAEKITKEEVDRLFCDAKKVLENIETQE